MLKHKETKSHIKNGEHFATRGDLRDVEHRLDMAILATKHEVKESELQLRHEIKETELRLKLEIEGVKGDIKALGDGLKGEIKALSNSKWFDRSLFISVFVLCIAPYIKPLNTVATNLIQYFS